MKRKITLALFVAVFLSLSAISFGANVSSPKVGLSQDLIYFVMPDRYKDGDKTNNDNGGFNTSLTAFYHGGLRWVLVKDDCLAFLRESKKETILVFISRKAVKTSIDLNKLEYVVKESLYGISGDGSTITINEGSPAQGVWVLESSQKLSG